MVCSVASVSSVCSVIFCYINLRMVIKNVTDLDVYQDSLEVLPILYKFLAKVPHSELDTIIQVKRAGKAIPAIIAEGFAKRNSSKEFRRYLLIAIGSSDEIVTHLRVISIIIPALSVDTNILINTYITISKRLNTLHKKWDINNLRQKSR